MKINKPDEENEEAESGKDRGEWDENQVTKVFGGWGEEKDLQKVGQYQVLWYNACFKEKKQRWQPTSTFKKLAIIMCLLFIYTMYC